jgi:protocatechuate 3,4-dioxygenase beta subunit
VKVLVLIVVCATLYASVGSAQSTGSVQWYDSRRGTGVINGHVSTVDGAPASGADVLLSTHMGRRRILADKQGWFEFTGLIAGEYQVSATMAGYLTRAYGQTLEAGQPAPIRMTNGRVRSNIDIVLPRSGVVTVQVRDEFNAPVEGASVRVNHASQYYREGGRWHNWSGPSTKQRTATTNDQGEIRVVDLGPGDYYVEVGPPGTSRATFYPGVSRFDDAVPVTLAPGQELTVGVPVIRPGNVRPPSPRGVITVHVTDESGNPREGVEVRALAVIGDGDSRSMTRAPLVLSHPDSNSYQEFYTDGNGDARIYGLQGGQYVVVAQPLLSHVVSAKRTDREMVLPPIYYPGSPVAADAQPVSIAPWSEVSLDLRLAPVPAARIAGRVVRADGEASQSTVVLRWNPDGPLYSESISTAGLRVRLVDGAFVFPTVHPGDYIVETDDGDLLEPEGYGSASVKVVQGQDIDDLVLTLARWPPQR